MIKTIPVEVITRTTIKDIIGRQISLGRTRINTVIDAVAVAVVADTTVRIFGLVVPLGRAGVYSVLDPVALVVVAGQPSKTLSLCQSGWVGHGSEKWSMPSPSKSSGPQFAEFVGSLGHASTMERMPTPS